MRVLFMPDTSENIGKNWLIADFGTDRDDKAYILTTHFVRASEAGLLSEGAKSDANLCAVLLNAYHNGLLDNTVLDDVEKIMNIAIENTQNKTVVVGMEALDESR